MGVARDKKMGVLDDRQRQAYVGRVGATRPERQGANPEPLQDAAARGVGRFVGVSPDNTSPCRLRVRPIEAASRQQLGFRANGSVLTIIVRFGPAAVAALSRLPRPRRALPASLPRLAFGVAVSHPRRDDGPLCTAAAGAFVEAAIWGRAVSNVCLHA